MATNMLLLARLEGLLEEVSMIKKVIAEQTLLELTEEPKCPECGCGILRPTCMGEKYDCPRHQVIWELGGHDVVWRRVSEIKKNAR